MRLFRRWKKSLIKRKGEKKKNRIEKKTFQKRKKDISLNQNKKFYFYGECRTPL